MKKISVFLMTVFMVLYLAACGSGKPNQPVQGVIENSKKTENTETTANDGTDVAESTETKPDNNMNTDIANTANSEENAEKSTGSNMCIHVHIFYSASHIKQKVEQQYAKRKIHGKKNMPDNTGCFDLCLYDWLDGKRNPPVTLCI